MKRFILFSIFCFVQMLTCFSYANSGRLYTSNDMSSSLIRCIIQDKYGFIWVGTNYGLNRFDGYKFSSYLCNPADTTTIQDNDIVKLYPYSKEFLFVATNRGLYKYSYLTNCFQHIVLEKKDEKIRVSSLIEDGKHNLLIGTAGYGAYRLDMTTGKVTRLSRKSANSVDDFFAMLFFDDEGYLWQANHTKVLRKYKYNGKSIKLVSVYEPKDLFGISKLYATDKKGFFVAHTGGIMRYDYASHSFSRYDFDFSAHQGAGYISAVTLDKYGNLWLGTSGDGTFKIPHGSRKAYRVELNNQSFIFDNAHISDLLIDRDGNQWYGCYMKGLFLSNNDKNVFHPVSLDELGAGMETISSVVGVADGLMLFVVKNHGLYLLDEKTGNTKLLQSPAGPIRVYSDFRKNVYVYGRDGIYEYDWKHQTYRLLLPANGLSLDGMQVDAAGNIYFTSPGNGLYVWNRKSGKMTQYLMDDKRPHKTICNNWISEIRLDSRGWLWCATANGVSCMDTKTGYFDIILSRSLLEGKTCYSTLELSDGKIAIATEMGLYLYDRKKQQTTPWPHSESISGLRIYSLKKDAKGNLWMSTAQGIWCYDSKAKSFFSFEKGNGLLTKEYLAGVVGSTSDGVICYGNSEGLTYFRPSQVKDYNEKTSVIYLSGVLLDGKMAPFIGDNLSVPSDFKSIVLSFSQLDYQSVGNIVFQYRINGGKWISNAAGDNSFNFTGLSYGHYRIEVRTYCNGKYSTYKKVINLDVLAPWFLTVWAKLIYLFLILGLTAAAIIVYLRKKKRDMEEAKMQFLINATHDIRSPLTLIMEPLKKLKERLGNAEEYQADIDTIDRNAQRLLTLVNQILDKRRLDKHQMNLSCRETNLVEFSQGLVSLFTYNANLRGINIRLEMPETPVNAWIDRNKLDKAIANLLSNAFKYTPNGGEIIFRIEKQDKKVLLYVIDSGKGLGKNDDAKTLFERFYQGQNSADMHLGGSGIGLNLCRSIVRLHGGDVYAHNREDGKSGACFIIELPLGKEHLKDSQINSDYVVNGKKLQRSGASKNSKILLVDDDIEICRYIKTELSDWYRFVICNNGKEALKQLLTDDFDLVVSDVVMPEMDGITLLRNIKGNANISHVPVIMLTSKSEISDRLEGIKLGADAYLAKPFSLEELHLTIDNLIDNVRRLKGKFSGALKQDDKVEKVEVKGYDEELMERIMKVVNENLSDSDFNVEKMCDEVGVSRTQLHRKLKEMTGVPTSEFLRNIRLNEAARLIRERKINITQVSYMVGFANNSHFSTAFKKYFGMSPSEYAAKYTE
ncbi:response regulator [Segatella copri]|uniref:histidine kinase n=1 Tax=Segatella copri TaxID=165179 RepID=A0AAW9TF70_9BACT|nr:response regulator [Segatella copri]MQN26887.1 response regulator [Segatella copri]MQN32051.1 response regulator [Segatella copri]MQN38436.1 response regulator [Segatella copri]MQN75881.1 response regulator [Segatella copri]MQO27155.1 response regulator [Segatella copri]